MCTIQKDPVETLVCIVQMSYDVTSIIELG